MSQRLPARGSGNLSPSRPRTNLNLRTHMSPDSLWPTAELASVSFLLAEPKTTAHLPRPWAMATSLSEDD